MPNAKIIRQVVVPDGTLVNALLYHWKRESIAEIKDDDIGKVLANRRPGIVHRLDRDTSGLVLEATYSDGSVKQIRSGYTLNTNKANHLGQKTITVSFDGQTAGFKIKTSFSLVSLIKSIFSIIGLINLKKLCLLLIC